MSSRDSYIMLKAGFLEYDEDGTLHLNGAIIRSTKSEIKVPQDDVEQLLVDLLRLYRPVIRRNKKLHRAGLISKEEIMPVKVRNMYWAILQSR